MTTTAAGVSIVFPDYFDECVEEEVALKGWLSEAIVLTDAGERFQMFFVDPARLEQMLADKSQRGFPFVAEPNLVVLPEVTRAAIRVAVTGLAQQGFFRHLKPMP